jgi:DnaJ-class molecular chaperone
VIFQVESATHPIYRRENDDLHLELKISSQEAKDGCKKIIKALDQKEKSIGIKIPPNVYSYEKQRKKQKQEKSSSSNIQYDNNIRIKNRGWPIRNNIQSSDIHPDVYLYGDLIVKIKVLKKSSEKRGQQR